MLPVTINLIQCLSIIVPDKWLFNSIGYSIGMIYLAIQTYRVYGVYSSDIVSSTAMSIFWFTFSNVLLRETTRSLYSTILNSERLIREMKKILQIFPHGVIINPFGINNIEKKIFTNQEFDSKMVKINQDIDILRDIKVDIQSRDADFESSQAINTTLHNFLKHQQEKMHEDDIVVERGVKVHCQPDRNSNLLFENENTVERVCTVKTLSVEWEGVKSCMHVFIDNSDIIKLEEAKNNNR
jgi:hypothetical protein